MDERIIEFIKAQKVASIACVDQQGNPYCDEMVESAVYQIFYSYPGV